MGSNKPHAFSVGLRHLTFAIIIAHSLQSLLRETNSLVEAFSHTSSSEPTIKF